MIVKQVTDCVNDRKQVELCINSLLRNKGMMLHFSNLYYCLISQYGTMPCIISTITKTKLVSVGCAPLGCLKFVGWIS